MIAGIRSRLNQAPVRCMLNPASIIEPASIVDGWKKAGLYRESGGVSESPGVGLRRRVPQDVVSTHKRVVGGLSS